MDVNRYLVVEVNERRRTTYAVQNTHTGGYVEVGFPTRTMAERHCLSLNRCDREGVDANPAKAR